MQRDGVVFGQLRAGFQFPAGAEFVCILPSCPDWLGGPYSLLSEGHRRPHWQGYVGHSTKLTRGILLESKDTYSFASTLPRHLSNVVARLGRPTGVTWTFTYTLFTHLPQIKTLFVNVRYQVLTATRMEITAFWDSESWSIVEVHTSFRCTYYLHNNRLDGGGKQNWNVGILLWDYKAQYPRRLTSSGFITVIRWDNSARPHGFEHWQKRDISRYNGHVLRGEYRRTSAKHTADH
jgi:hypothetical protein